MSEIPALDVIVAIDHNGYFRGWLDCKERVLKITGEFSGQGVAIHEMVKELKCPL